MATTRYEVQHSYQSFRDGQQYGPWQAGETVELSETDAEWVCRDSPGCLLAAGDILEAEREKPAGRDRQHRGGRNRSGS